MQKKCTTLFYSGAKVFFRDIPEMRLPVANFFSRCIQLILLTSDSTCNECGAISHHLIGFQLTKHASPRDLLDLFDFVEYDTVASFCLRWYCNPVLDALVAFCDSCFARNSSFQFPNCQAGVLLCFSKCIPLPLKCYTFPLLPPPFAFCAFPRIKKYFP